MPAQPLAEAAKRGHEQIAYFNYPAVCLKAIIAVHSTVLGPGLGGCRMRLYTDEEQALDDVMRLSEGMTYKSALAGLDLGGGKACIIADHRMTEGREELFTQFGKCVEAMAGRYVTAEDMGTSVPDMTAIGKNTKWVVGTDTQKGGGGDPSPWTARGVYAAIIAACERIYGTRDLQGRRVAIQGIGHVGRCLLELLRQAGAQVIVCDTNESATREVKDKFGAEVVVPDGIYDADCDVFSPCAIGQTVNHQTISRLRCKIIAGAANNQLIDSSVYDLLQKRNILYCPDFAINSGGVICVGAELIPGGWKEDWVREKVGKIEHTVKRILDEAEKRGKFPEVVALELASERIQAARR